MTSQHSQVDLTDNQTKKWRNLFFGVLIFSLAVGSIPWLIAYRKFTILSVMQGITIVRVSLILLLVTGCMALIKSKGSNRKKLSVGVLCIVAILMFSVGLSVVCDMDLIENQNPINKHFIKICFTTLIAIVGIVTASWLQFKTPNSTKS